MQTNFSKTEVYLFDEPKYTVLRISGQDALSWLNSVAAGEVTEATHESAIYTLLLDKKGKIQSDAWVLREKKKEGNEQGEEPSFFLFVPTQKATEIKLFLERFLIMEDVEITFAADFSTTYFWYEPLNREEVGKASWLFDEATKEHHFCVARLAHLNPKSGGDVAAYLCMATRTEKEKCEHFFKKNHLELATQNEWHRWRLRWGIAQYGIDFDSTMYPQEAGLEHKAISWTKGCYLGQEVVCKLEMRGRLGRRLVRVVEVMSGGADLSPISPIPNQLLIDATGKEVGQLKSFHDGYGFALVKLPYVHQGQSLWLSASEPEAAATVREFTVVGEG